MPDIERVDEKKIDTVFFEKISDLLQRAQRDSNLP